MAQTYTNDEVVYNTQLNEQRIQDAENNKEAKFTSWDKFVSAVGQEHILSNYFINKELGLNNPTIDPNYQLPSVEKRIEDVKALGLPEEAAFHLYDSVSEEHYQKRLNRILVEYDDKERLNGSIMWSLTGAVTDPTAWVAGMGLGAAGKVAGVTRSATRLGNAAKVGGAAAVESAAIEGYIYSQQETREADSIVYAGISGLAFGGLLGSLIKRADINSSDISNAILDDANAIIEQSRKGYKETHSKSLIDKIETLEAKKEELRLERKGKQDTLKGIDFDRAEITKSLSKQVDDELEILYKKKKELENKIAYDTKMKQKDIDTKKVGKTKATGDMTLMEIAFRNAKGAKHFDTVDTNLNHPVKKELEAVNAKIDELKGRQKNNDYDIKDATVADKLSSLAKDRKVLDDEVSYINEQLGITKADIEDLKIQYKEFTSKYADDGETLDLETSVGAKQTDNAEIEIDDGNDIRDYDSMSDKVKNEPTAYGAKWLRSLDSAGFLGKSLNPFIRYLSRLGEDGVGLKVDKAGNKVASEHSAEEIAHAIESTTTVNWARDYMPAFEEYAKNANKKINDAEKHKFGKLVAEAYESGIKSPDASINKAVAATKKFFNEYKKLLEETGLAKEHSIHFNDNYLPQILDAKSFRKTVDEIGERDVADLLYQSMVAKSEDKMLNRLMSKDLNDNNIKSKEDYDAEIAKRITEDMRIIKEGVAEAYVKHFLNKSYFSNLNALHSFSFGDVNDIRKLVSELGVKDDADSKLAKAINRLEKDNIAINKSGRFKARIEFDMYKAFKLDSGEMKVADLFQKDPMQLVPMYARSTAGHIGITKATGIKSMYDLNTMFKHALDWERETGSKTKNLNAEAKEAEYLYKALTGVPLEADPMSMFSNVARRMRKANNFRLLGQVGFAQLPETGRAIAMMGAKAMFQQMPALRKLFSTTGGKLDDDLLREIEEFVGTGTQALRNKVFIRSDLDEAGVTEKSIDVAMDKMNNFVFDWSGMNPITTASQRALGAGIAQKLYNMAIKKTLKKSDIQELASYGLKPDMQDRVLKQLQRNAKIDGGTLKKIELEKWTDSEASNAFTLAIQRAVRRGVQETTYGGSRNWMHSSALAKVLLQFRSFQINALTKQLLNGVAMRDAVAAYGLSYSMLLGALAYTAQTHLRYGNDKRKLEEKMEAKNVIAAAVRRSGQSSFVPDAIETIIYHGTGGTVHTPFAGSRSTQGLSESFILGNPTVQLGQSLLKIGVGTPNSIVNPDYRFSKGDLRAWQSILPNLYGVNNAFQYIADELRLPKESIRRE